MTSRSSRPPARRRLAGAISHPYAAARHALGSTVESICRKRGLAVVFHTRAGVKSFNSPIRAEPLDYPAYRTSFVDMPAADLALGFDGLKDAWTLLDTPLAESPHGQLMEALVAEKPIESTDYVMRARAGTLDWRRPLYISAGFLASLRSRFEAAAERIAAGERPLVKVASLADRTYLVDGKHRASLALVLGVDVRCEDVTVFFYDSYFAWVERRMLERPSEYSEQLRLLALARTALRSQPPN